MTEKLVGCVRMEENFSTYVEVSPFQHNTRSLCISPGGTQNQSSDIRIFAKNTYFSCSPNFISIFQNFLFSWFSISPFFFLVSVEKVPFQSQQYV